VFERETACLLEGFLVGGNEVVVLLLVVCCSWWRNPWVVEEEFRPLPIHRADDNDPSDFVRDDNDNTKNILLDSSLVVVRVMVVVAAVVSWPILLKDRIWKDHKWKVPDSHGVVVVDTNHNDTEAEDLERPNDLREVVAVDVDRTGHVPRAIFDTNCPCPCCCCKEKDDNTEVGEVIVLRQIVSDPTHVVAVVDPYDREICFLVPVILLRQRNQEREDLPVPEPCSFLDANPSHHSLVLRCCLVVHCTPWRRDEKEVVELVRNVGRDARIGHSVIII
jgi:hypothetical protein